MKYIIVIPVAGEDVLFLGTAKQIVNQMMKRNFLGVRGLNRRQYRRNFACRGLKIISLSDFLFVWSLRNLKNIIWTLD